LTVIVLKYTHTFNILTSYNVHTNRQEILLYFVSIYENVRSDALLVSYQSEVPR